MHHTRWLLLVSTLGLGACNGAAATGGIDHDAYSQNSASLVTTESALELSDDVIGFDPVLVRGNTADQNAMDVETHTRASLTGCGTVTRTGAMLTVDFGSAGCTTPSGHVVSGSIGVLIGANAGEATAALTFTSFVLDGTALSGTLGFRTSATTLGVSIDLTSGTSATTTLSGSLTIIATSGAFGLDGVLTSTRASTQTTIAITSLRWTRGECYPGEGSIDATTGRIEQTMTFTSSTAMTGIVEVSEGPITTTQMLPPYGSCPN